MKKEIYPQKLINDYDLVMSAYPQLFRLREKVALRIKKYFKNFKEVVILEIGAGAGETTQYILQQTDNVKIIAVDNDENMCLKLRNNLKSFIDNGRLDIINQDIFQYIKGLKEANFDGVTSSWSIHNFTKEKRAILFKEIYRILKPQGLFVNMDKYVNDNPIKEQKSFDEVVSRLNKIPKKDIAQEAIEHEDNDRQPSLIMPEKESLKLIREFGFKNVKILKRINREAVLSCVK